LTNDLREVVARWKVGERHRVAERLAVDDRGRVGRELLEVDREERRATRRNREARLGLGSLGDRENETTGQGAAMCPWRDRDLEPRDGRGICHVRGDERQARGRRERTDMKTEHVGVDQW
jgi:hypothetical protein